MLRARAGLTLMIVVFSGCGPDGIPQAGMMTATDEQAVTVCAAGAVVQGVDVSVYQGNVDWPTVAGTGIVFAVARISDGMSLDSKFSQNWSGMKSAGLVRGAYQFFEPADDPTTQANIVIQAVGMLGQDDLPVVADMEVSGGQSAATIVSKLNTWVAAVQAGTGRAPMIYTAPGFWNSSVASSSFGNLPLWAANWGVTCPNLATGWSNWDVWQYSDMGTVSGITGAVDLDEFNGSLEQLKQFANGAPTYAAQYVSQSWPLATTTMTMTAGQTMPASITFKNIGSATWDSNTRLATTQPRDRMSAFAGSDWVSPSRLSAVTGTVPPGATFEFAFSFHAPADAGFYDELFGLVEDGVGWFSAPPDNDIEAKIEVVPSDAGTPDAGAQDAGVPDAGAVHLDAGEAPPDAGQPGPAPRGCGCATTPEAPLLALLLLLAMRASKTRRSWR
jgi:lysozyme